MVAHWPSHTEARRAWARGRPCTRAAGGLLRELRRLLPGWPPKEWVSRPPVATLKVHLEPSPGPVPSAARPAGLRNTPRSPPASSNVAPAEGTAGAAAEGPGQEPRVARI